jgi:hypothetical protein
MALEVVILSTSILPPSIPIAYCYHSMFDSLQCRDVTKNCTGKLKAFSNRETKTSCQAQVRIEHPADGNDVRVGPSDQTKKNLRGQARHRMNPYAQNEFEPNQLTPSSEPTPCCKPSSTGILSQSQLSIIACCLLPKVQNEIEWWSRCHTRVLGYPCLISVQHGGFLLLL